MIVGGNYAITEDGVLTSPIFKSQEEKDRTKENRNGSSRVGSN